MRGNFKLFQFQSVTKLNEALRILKSQEWKPIAGGTDLMVLFSAGKLAKAKYLDIWGIEELKKIKVTSEFLELGALVTYSQIRENKVIQKEFPNLVKAAAETGAIAIQNRGTIGGNIANASPAADTPPALLCYDAVLVLQSLMKTREVKYENFHKDYKKMDLAPDELIIQIRIPRVKTNRIHFYRKVGTRKAQAISKVCFSGVLRKSSGKISSVKIGLGSIAAMPVRALETEKYLSGKKIAATVITGARKVLSKEIKPIDDIRSTAAYRLEIAENILEQFLNV